MREKVYVEVIARFNSEGDLVPMSVIWQDGTRFLVDRVLSVQRRASLKAGGAGVRYTCRIHNAVTYLFLEDSRWFVEAKLP